MKINRETLLKKENLIMKKNIRTSKQVIKALSIGLSASMLLSSQGAFAAEGDTTLKNDDNGDNNATVTAPTEEKHSVVDDAQGAEKTAEKSISAADEKVDAVVTAAGDFKDAVTEGKVDQIADTAEGLANEIDTNVSTAGNSEFEIKDELNNAEDASLREAADLGVMEKAVVSANNVIYGTSDVSGVDEVLTEAKEDISSNIEEINGATTIASAKDSLDEAEASEKEATDTYENAKAEYDAASAAYDAALADLEVAQQAYRDALKNASNNANAADAALEAAKASAEMLEAELAAAEAELKKDAAYDILCEEEVIKNEKATEEKTDWNAYNELFNDIMKNYYIPEVEKGSDVEVKEFTKYSNQDEYSYCEVTYKDKDGNEQTKYYNYKLNADKTGVEIFEKTLTYSYEDTDSKKVMAAYEESELNEMLAAGTAVKATDNEGKDVYVILDGTVSTNDIVKEASTTSDDGKVVTSVDIDEDTQKVKVTFDDGTAIWTTTANVITTTVETVEGKTGEYASKTDAEKELAEKGLDEDSLTAKEESKVTSYDAKATYVVSFTDYEKFSNKRFDYAGNKGLGLVYGAYDFVEEERNEHTFKENHKEYQISENDTLTVTENRNDYYVNGNITVTYAKTVSKTVDYTTWDGVKDLWTTLFKNGETNKEKIETLIRQQVEAEGGYYAGIVSWDWNSKTATVYYVPANSVTETIECDTEAEAIDAIKAIAQKEAQKSTDSGRTGNATNIQNVTVTPSSYLYWIEYSGTKTEKDVSENETVSVKTQSGKELEKTYLSNKIWNDRANTGNAGITSSASDEDFRNWLSDAQGKKDAYDTLKEELTKAQAALNKAATDVDTLKKEISKLIRNQNVNEEHIGELKAQMNTAKEKLTGAKEDYEEVKELAEEARKAYEEAVERLTPPANEEDEDDDTPATTETTPIVTAAIATPAAPAAVRTVAPTAPVEEEVIIVEEETPLAETVEEKTEEPEKVDETVVIDDSETPLAPAVAEEAMSWWWILIVLALGTTGAELYRRHQVKKNAAKVEEDK